MRLLGVSRQFGACQVHARTHVVECLVGVEAGIELENDHPAALGSGSAHFLHALDGAQLGFHGADQHAFGIFGRDAFVQHVDVHLGNRDVRFRFLGNGRIADRTGDQKQQHDRNDRPGAFDEGGDQGIHCAATLTRWPSVT